MKEISSEYFIPRGSKDILASLNKRVRMMPTYSYPHFKDFDHRVNEHTNRYFIHMDFDSFYAQVEQRDLGLRGKPVAVGGSSDGRGIVMTASHEARQMGIDEIMSMREALQICPNLVCLPCYGPKYEAITLRILEMLEEFVPEDCIEQYSIDECFAELTPSVKNWKEAIDLARAIQDKVKKIEDLTISAGLSYNKTYAKLLTKTKKAPGHFAFARKDEREEKIFPLKPGKIWGIGKRIERRLVIFHVNNTGDLARIPQEALRKEFGINGIVFSKMARGEDTSGIFKKKEHEKTLNHHHTLSSPLHKKEDLLQEVRRIGEYLCRKLRAKRLAAKSIALAVRFPNLSFLFAEGELPQHSNDDRAIYELAVKLLLQVMQSSRFKEQGKVRMFGMTLFGLKMDLQRANLSLYENNVHLPYNILDQIKEKYGDHIIRVGVNN